MKNQTSIIIINYNNSVYLEKCLKAALANNPFEIIVVDDCSTDDSVSIIQNYPEIKLIINKENYGPVKSRNVGAKIAEGKYLLFLDSDAELESTYVSVSESIFENNSEIGGLSGKVIEVSTGDRMWFNCGHDSGDLRGFIGFIFSKFIAHYSSPFLKRIAEPYTLNYIPDEERVVDWVVEMAFVTRKDVFEKIGGFDENFYMFFEGPDYCKSVRKNGYKILFAPSVYVKHLGGHSHTSKSRSDFFNSSKKYYFKKWK